MPLSAILETILLHLVYMAETFKYVTIINYLPAVWLLHKLAGVDHMDPKPFEIHITLRGIRRYLGDVQKQARPVSLLELLSIYSCLDFSKSEDLAFWCAIVLCFRGLLRKSNVVEEGLAILVGDVIFFEWGALVSVGRTKTICFKERVLEIPFSYIYQSPFYIASHLKLLSLRIAPAPDHQLISYLTGGKITRGTYVWFSARLKKVSTCLRLESITSHSLHRGGTSAMADAGFSLLDIKNLGDWSSLSLNDNDND